LPKLPVLSADDVIKALKRAGYRVLRQTGSHIHLWNDDERLLVTVPNHSELAKGTLKSIIKQAKMTRSEFLAWVR
jgi:predicted RNA binding protein YcfA (HicA-like mRNA interferase family)